MPRRAIASVRGSVLKARRVLARADAIESARRSLAATDPEPPLVRPRDVAQHLKAGVLSSSAAGRGEPRVVVGRYAAIAHGVEFHPREDDRSGHVAQFPLRARLGVPADDGPPAAGTDILIGHDAWLGQGCVVMSGVTIGPGAVVEMRSVVTEDVPPYAIVGGVPAKRIGQRFSDEQIAALLRIAWWDWPAAAIGQRAAELCSPDVDAFIAAYDPGRTP